MIVTCATCPRVSTAMSSNLCMRCLFNGRRQSHARDGADQSFTWIPLAVWFENTTRAILSLRFGAARDWSGHWREHIMRKLIALIGAAAAVGFGAQSALSETTTIRLETYAGPRHAMNAHGWPDWIKQADAATGGSIKFAMSYPPIDPRALYDRVRNGIADMAWITHGYTTGRFVMPEIVELPNVDGNGEQMSRALWRIHAKYFSKLGEYKGVHVMTVFTHGPGMLHTSKPIAKMADFQGLKIRSGGGVQAAIAKRLGFVSVSAPATKAHELLSQGVADGVFFSLETITSFKLGDVVKYHYSLPGGFYTASFAVIMNKAKYDSLSAAQKTALAKVTGEPMAALMGKTWDDADKVSAKALTETKNTIAPFPPALAAEIHKKLADIELEWIARAKAAGLADPAAVLKELRADIAKIKSGG
ncbi:MAG: TRAP transporter substrate-binding protein [Rhodospirillaceae bacterium]|nr:TRAP transporter substrate-binding protein [Rhodospirillaceae bacterium]